MGSAAVQKSRSPRGGLPRFRSGRTRINTSDINMITAAGGFLTLPYPNTNVRADFVELGGNLQVFSGALVVGDRDGEPTPQPPKRTAREDELSERLRDLDRELDVRRASREADMPAVEEEPAGRRYGLALRLGADFVAGIVVGGALGWGVDRLFGTSPWGLMVFLLFGFAAGVLTLLRSAGMVKPGPPGPDDKI